MIFDKRIVPFRDDLAAETLRGQVSADRFAKGTKKIVTASLVSLHRAPHLTAAIDTQILMGDSFIVYEEQNGWVWGQVESDHYVGYIPKDVLKDWTGAPTHCVNVLRTFCYPAPNMKSPALDVVSFKAGVHCIQNEGDFVSTANGTYIFKEHLSPWDSPLTDDYVTIAEQFVGTPYLWGGKSSIGIDCSGLVQTALRAICIQAPRDSDMQEAQLGNFVDINPDLSNLKRGDLIFWKGHVGIMTSPTIMLHATAYRMLTYTEPLAGAEKRIRETTGNPITAIKRIAMNK